MQRIGDEPYVLPYMAYDSSKYYDLLEEKRLTMVEHFSTLFDSLEEARGLIPTVDLISSPPVHSRQKCRFGIGRDDASESNLLVHMMWKFGGGPVIVVDSFPIASRPIYNMMPVFIALIQSKSEYACLADSFTSVSYLSTLSEHLLITMVYERTDDDAEACTEEAWRTAAESLLVELNARNVAGVQQLSLIGRWKGVKIVVGRDFVYETLHLADGRRLVYKQVDEGFSNPNSSVSCKALDWLCGIATVIVQENEVENEGAPMDLLEMYCGNGNHTCALAAYFSRILAVEINPNLCAAAEENFKLNSITTAHVLVCDSAKFANQVLRTKKYTLYAPAVTASDSYEGKVTEGGSVINTSDAPANMSTRSKKKYEAALRHSARSGKKNASSASAEQTPAGEVATAEAEVEAEAINASIPSASGIKAVETINVPLAASPVERVPLYTFRFGAVLVDPPRCGLDKLTLSLVAGYSHILYISCSPESLMRDLKALLRTHTLRRIALFDQFAYTPHIETGVWLQIKK